MEVVEDNDSCTVVEVFLALLNDFGLGDEGEVIIFVLEIELGVEDGLSAVFKDSGLGVDEDDMSLDEMLPLVDGLVFDELFPTDKGVPVTY